MKTVKILMILVLLLSMTTVAIAAGPGNGGGGKGGSGGEEADVAGNNLSYPVIWSEGITKVLPGTAEMTPTIAGTYWYQWGTNGVDPNITPASCPPDPDEVAPVTDPYCDDGIAGSLTTKAGFPPADNPLPLARAYLQKDPGNVWQAWNGLAVTVGATNTLGGVDVDWIDWGDNLESVDWYTRSQVRTEVVLFEDILEPLTLLEYEMRHTSGWGIDEVHGMATDLTMAPLLGPGTRATVYSHCARLTIQKLLVPRDDSRLAVLVWVPGVGWSEPEGYADNLINPAIFNKPVYEGGDGPGYYAAEINVKGRIIYGYTWNVRTMNDNTPIEGSTVPTAAGDYRITFSLDKVCGTVNLATHFVEGTTQIIVPIEEEEVVSVAAEEVGAGATAVLVPAEFSDTGVLVAGNLTYMDVHILARGGGGGGGGGGRPQTLGVGDCDVQSQVHMRQMEQLQTRLQSECPGDNCPCTDIAGNSCQQFRNQLTSMVNTMHRLQLETFCDGNGCQCICANGTACLEARAKLQTLMQTREQLLTQCGDGGCEVDTEFFDSLELEIAAMATLLDGVRDEYDLCLPSVQAPE